MDRQKALFTIKNKLPHIRKVDFNSNIITPFIDACVFLGMPEEHFNKKIISLGFKNILDLIINAKLDKHKIYASYLEGTGETLLHFGMLSESITGNTKVLDPTLFQPLEEDFNAIGVRDYFKEKIIGYPNNESNVTTLPNAISKSTQHSKREWPKYLWDKGLLNYRVERLYENGLRETIFKVSRFNLDAKQLVTIMCNAIYKEDSFI